ncbi:MAG: GldG family protein [Clostridia bacterium]|nr:GldG family protein [Clostridia bacterium]
MNLNKRTKMGTYTVVMIFIVLAVLVFVNLAAVNAPSQYTKLDTTSLDLYTLSDMTKDALGNVTEDIKIYFLCSGGEDASGNSLENLPQLSIYLERYANLNKHIKVDIVDPVKDPNFTLKYTEDTLDNYSIIVESAKRAKIIPFTDLYYYYNDSFGVISTELYSTFMYYYYSNYGQMPELTLNFNGDSVITSALDYVTTDRIPAVYALTGHGETAFDETLATNITDNSLLYGTLSLLTSDIPEETELIIINTPTIDISEVEISKLSEYLDKGGNLFITTSYKNPNLPNLYALLAEYGLSAISGVILDQDPNYYYAYPYYLLPSANSSSALTAEYASSVYMIMPEAHGILSGGETEKNVSSVPLFTTSTSALKVEIESEEDDYTEAQYDVAVHVLDNESGANIIWFGSNAFMDDYNSVTGGNYQYFMSITDKIVERDRITNNIPANAITGSYLIVNEAQKNMWMVILVIIIPVTFAICGVAYWYVRRRK